MADQTETDHLSDSTTVSGTLADSEDQHNSPTPLSNKTGVAGRRKERMLIHTQLAAPAQVSLKLQPIVVGTLHSPMSVDSAEGLHSTRYTVGKRGVSSTLVSYLGLPTTSEFIATMLQVGVLGVIRLDVPLSWVS